MKGRIRGRRVLLLLYFILPLLADVPPNASVCSRDLFEYGPFRPHYKEWNSSGTCVSPETAETGDSSPRIAIENETATLKGPNKDVNNDASTTDSISTEPSPVTSEKDADASSSDTENPDAATTETRTTEESDGNDIIDRVAVDYASKSVGALIVDSSKEFQGTSNLLQKDRDKYAIVPCEEPNKYVTIGLSEDILVKQIVIKNYERYSSSMKEIRISATTTDKNWVDVGTYQTTRTNSQVFGLENPTWARYLKFEFMSYYGDEHYCTVSQISVHGSTMLQGFHEQWEDDDDGNNSEDETLEANAPDSIDTDSMLVGDSKGKHDLDESSNDSVALAVPPRAPSITPNRLSSLRDDFERTMKEFVSRSSPSPEPFCMTICHPSSRNRSVSVVKLLDKPKATTKWNHFKTNRKVELIADHEELRLSANLVYPFGQSLPATSRLRSLVREAVFAWRSLSSGRESDFEMANLIAEGIEEEVLIVSADTLFETTDSATINESEIADSKNVVEAEEQPEASEDAISGDEQAIELEKDADTEHLKDTSNTIAKLLNRLPSASCLHELDLERTKAALLQTKGSGPEKATGPQSGAMEPIFKKLTNEIKALQSLLVVHETFARDAVLCYQSVLMDLMLEMEALRTSTDDRLLAIEKDLQWGGWLLSFQLCARATAEGILHTIRTSFSVAASLAAFCEDHLGSRALAAMVTFVLVCASFLSKAPTNTRNGGPGGRRAKMTFQQKPGHPEPAPLKKEPTDDENEPGPLMEKPTDDENDVPELSDEPTTSVDHTEARADYKSRENTPDATLKNPPPTAPTKPRANDTNSANLVAVSPE